MPQSGDVPKAFCQMAVIVKIKIIIKNNENHRPNLKNQGNCPVYIGADAAGDGLYPFVQDPVLCSAKASCNIWNAPDGRYILRPQAWPGAHIDL